MELGDLELLVGESAIIDDLYIHRNDYGYLVLRESHQEEGLDNTLCVQDKYYRYYSVEDLTTYQIKDFE